MEHAIAVADDAARRYAPDEEARALAQGLDLLADGDDRRGDLLVRRATALVATDQPIDVRVDAAREALGSVQEGDGDDAAFTLLGRSVLDACALTGRIGEAEQWFDGARAVLTEQGSTPLLVGLDVDHAIMLLRIGTDDARVQARVLLDRATLGAAHPAMAPWHERITSLRAELG